MKFVDVERELHSSGSIFSKKVTIANNAKAFRIIINNLYSNIKLAMIREIIANAYDSHVSAGNVETPIQIKKPDVFEPFLTVRDYGTGMSRETIDKIYSVIYQSTKDQDNQGVGMYGMGSKTLWDILILSC